MRRPHWIGLIAAVAAVVAIPLLHTGISRAATNDLIVVTGEVQIDDIGIALRMGERGDEMQWKNMEPGLKINMTPSIENNGERDVYVRVQIGFEPGWLNQEEFGIQWSDGWLASEDGYMYYTRPMEVGDTAELFRNLSNDPSRPYTIRLPGSWVQETAPERFIVTITPQAVQADHFEPDFERGGFWNGVEPE